MRNVICVTAVLVILSGATGAFIALRSQPSPDRFCSDWKVGKAGPAGGLSDLIAGDRRQLEQILSTLGGKAAAANEACP